jgi:hypothetical protein
MLIALAILGLIAGFVVPKVLAVVDEQVQRAAYKETYAMVQELAYNRAMSVDPTEIKANFLQYLKTHSDYKEFSPSGAHHPHGLHIWEYFYYKNGSKLLLYSHTPYDQIIIYSAVNEPLFVSRFFVNTGRVAYPCGASCSTPRLVKPGDIAPTHGDNDYLKVFK